MRKLIIFCATIFICMVIAGLYGMVHSELNYSVSSEYYIKFMYDQFGFEQTRDGSHRPMVAAIGFYSSWWVGIPVGVVIGLITVLQMGSVEIIKSIRKAISIVLIFTVITGFTGYMFGGLAGAFRPELLFPKWYYPPGLVDYAGFNKVASVNNFTYLGVFFGLLVASIELLRGRSKALKKQSFYMIEN